MSAKSMRPDAEGDIWICGAEPKHGKTALVERLKQELGIGCLDGSSDETSTNPGVQA